MNSPATHTYKGPAMPVEWGGVSHGDTEQLEGEFLVVEYADGAASLLISEESANRGLMGHLVLIEAEVQPEPIPGAGDADRDAALAELDPNVKDTPAEAKAAAEEALAAAQAAVAAADKRIDAETTDHTEEPSSDASPSSPAPSPDF